MCSNECKLDEEDVGLCNLRYVKNGKLKSLVSWKIGLAHTYLDPLPTNCCASWLCPASSERGYNLAVFFYGCNFDCLYCQNWEHKNVDSAPYITQDEVVNEIKKNKMIKCICFFGGSPEPQLPFAIEVSERVLSEIERDVRICWEWNGSGNTKLVRKVASISKESGGIIKFDLKAWNENLHILLTGRSNRKTLENFRVVSEYRDDSHPDLLTATTLLVPYYVDEEEVKGIASFISSVSPDIPYSLLVFHPDYKLKDLPITPKEQVRECYKTAKMYLKRVNIGNLFLINL